MNTEFIPAKLNAVELYSEFRGQLAELKKQNQTLVFDYESPKGNKEARSHVYSIRKINAALEKARKEAKAEALEYGRLVDSKAKEIGAELDAMIEVHEAPLREIEQRESNRIAEHYRQIAVIEALGDSVGNSELLAMAIESVEQTTLGERWQEFEPKAAIAKDTALGKLRIAFAAAKKAEDEQAELARLRKESEARAQKEREEQIAREAAAKATREAEQAAERQRQADERASQERERKVAEAAREQELALERAKREKAEAEERAAKAERQAKENAERELLAKQEADRKAEQAREANRKHAAKINNEAVAALVDAGLPSDMAKLAVTTIALRKVPHVMISY